MRHAQEYWLRRQAKAAVAVAMEQGALEERAARGVADAMRIVDQPGLEGTWLRHQREMALLEAARALVPAEMLDREIQGIGA